MFATIGPRQAFRPQVLARDGRVARLLEEDEELADQLPERERLVATELIIAPVLEVELGSWTPPVLDAASSYGLFVLDGLIGRRVRVAHTSAMEILGPGDVLRPWDDPPLADALPLHTGWEIFKPARLAVLDSRVTSLFARWPELSVALSGRLLRRTERLTYLLAVSHLSRIEDRLLATLWYLGASWGHVTPQGLRVPLTLTHQALGEIAGAQRPSVSIAMASLRDRQLVARLADGTYVLCGEPDTWQHPPLERLVPAQ